MGEFVLWGSGEGNVGVRDGAWGCGLMGLLWGESGSWVRGL